MFVQRIFLVNPFFEAYIQADLLGKSIFIALVLLSIISWILLLYKVWITYSVRKNSMKFNHVFQLKKQNPLNVEFIETKNLNPFYELYLTLKKNTIEILNKNRLFGLTQSDQSKRETTAYLSPSDIDIVQAQLSAAIAKQTKQMEAHLFILSTIASLGPFLGLLGTVWGILTNFSEFQSHAGGNTNQMMISGLSLALTTTVLGLVDAIPALVAYNYLKNTIRDFETEMEGFSTEILASVEMQYRKVDVHYGAL